jgi:zinc carboxypeptidase
MKSYIVTILILCFSILSDAQNGWRPLEKEVKVTIENKSQATRLGEMGFNTDFYPGFAIVYVIPSEYKQLTESGLSCEVITEDLNLKYHNFWKSRDEYSSYAEIIDIMDSLVIEYPGICNKITYGTSLEGRELSALKISFNVMIDENEAEVMFDAGIHGDEIGGAENCIRFARKLCIDYGTDSLITELINSREIFIYPMVNPDGRENMIRYNANGVDLNRDWGYMWNGEGNSPDAFSQTETQCLRDCMYNNQFVIHTTYHSGTEYISYPWSYRSDIAPDKAHIDYLASTYSSTSGYSDLPYGQGNTGMYPINGSTKDGNYGIMGSISWSMEISMAKQPPPSLITFYYNNNVPAMLAMIEHAGYGLAGTITDAISGEPVQAIIYVDDFIQCYSDPLVGDYHKYVLPGTYSITVSANGYQSQTKESIVVSNYNSAAITNFQLQPDSGNYAYKIVCCRIPDNNEADEGNTKAVFGAPDSINYSIGKNGWIVIDMMEPIEDGEGNDFIIYEGDDSSEGYKVFASNSINGPWLFVADGSGTNEFDLSIFPLNSVQFIKVKDDGDGVANANNAGFDLDAIQDIDHLTGVEILLNSYVIVDTASNGNGFIDPGETVLLEVELFNTGVNEAVDVAGIISASPFLIAMIDPIATFGNIQPNDSALGTFLFSASNTTLIGQSISIQLEVTSNNGNYLNNYDLIFEIGETPVLIIDLDGNLNSGITMSSSCDSLDIFHKYLHSVPEDLSRYNSVFVCLGTADSNYILTNDEGELLKNYLLNGGNLYMEGGNTWYTDYQTPVHPLFNLIGIDDGSNQLSNITGLANTFVSDMTFDYSGDGNSIDHLESTLIGFEIFSSILPEYNCVVANDALTYKTIGSSFEFGSLVDGIYPSTKKEYFKRILDFFAGLYTSTPENSINENSILSDCFPNPFSQKTIMNFRVIQNSHVKLDIIDLSGRNVKTLLNSTFTKGDYSVTWNGINEQGVSVEPGIYLYQLQIDNYQITKKVLLRH